MAICGVADAEAGRKRPTLITSAVEHPATANVCAWLGQRGYEIHRLAVDRDGRVDPADLDPRLLQETALLTVMHSNNETGVLQPIASLARAAREAGALVHTDAAQSAGKVPIDVRALSVDLLSIAGHKLYAPKGVGALFVRRGVALSLLMRGASHESGRRPGTENVPGIVGLGAACEIARRDLLTVAARVAALRDRLWQLLQSQVPGILLNGHLNERLPNTLNVSFPGVSGNALLNATPGLCASTGSACHDGHDVASPVLQAMRLPHDRAVGAVRLTLGRATTEREIQQAAWLLARSWASLRDPAHISAG
jgi:cysteine desulfurase